MSIAVPCPRCRHVTHVPDSAGGKLGRCKRCSAICRIPLAPHQRKNCCVCNADISQTRRVKDKEGEYYCVPCWQAQEDASSATGRDFWDAVKDLDK